MNASASGVASVPITAFPIGIVFCYDSAEAVAAVWAHQQAGKEGFWPGVRNGFSPQYLLDPFKVGSGNYGWMVVFHVIGRPFSTVFYNSMRERVGRIVFLKQGVSDIPFITEDISDRGTAPLFFSAVPGDIVIIQIGHDGSNTAAVQIHPEDHSDDRGFRFINHQSPPDEIIAIGRAAAREVTALHSLLIAPAHIPGGRVGFVLSLGTHHTEEGFAGQFCRVNLVFLEQDADAEAGEQTHSFQAIYSVSGEAGDGFCQDSVYLAALAVRDHAIEFVSVLHAGTCNAVIGIKIGESPKGILADQFLVVFSLSFNGVLLIRRISGDPAVCRHTKDWRL